jgi:hypothetical protein
MPNQSLVNHWKRLFPKREIKQTEALGDLILKSPSANLPLMSGAII